MFAKKTVVGVLAERISLASLIELWQVVTPDNLHKYKRNTR